MAAELQLSASQIYEQITGGAGTDKLAEAQRAAGELRRKLSEYTNELTALAEQVNEAWHGTTGRLAENAALLLAVRSGRDSEELRRAAVALLQQIDAFDTVRRGVVPVPPEPPRISTDGLAAYLSGHASYFEELAAYRMATQNNIRAFAAYHEASVANGNAMPTTVSLAMVPGANIERAAFTPSAITERNAGDAQGAQDTENTDNADTRTALTSRSESGTSPRRSGESPTRETGTPMDGQFPETPDGAAASPANQHGPVRVAASPTTVAVDSSSTVRLPHASETASVESARPTPRGNGDSGGAGFNELVGRGPDAPHRTPPPPGPRGGLRGASPAQPNGMPPAGGQPGGNRGATGVPLGAASPRRGEDDRERKRPAYLLEPDPDETFAGPHERTVPPVVGDRPER
ncbi:hypothetical protein FHU38_004670 [Saccharomonospora amisosensis]|uniref:PPE family protein n=1 Tax=Saccharomonospora amisosensis TaxID=1128677 RepID=A0A7X5UU79_9PSEU|nr:hypothetical protein [Saccharomonospora amisosensis]NIJ14326.1 hypothetical protein [Saccharomonospora amisosensis]